MLVTAGDVGSNSGSGGSPGEENGNPLQYSCLENPMDRGAWRTIVHGVTKPDMTRNNKKHAYNTIKYQKMQQLSC